MVRLNDFAASVEPDDLRRRVEGTEHHAHSSILAEVRNRFDAAGHKVEVCDGRGAGDSKGIQAFRRDIDAADIPRRRGRHEEHMLGFNKRADLIVDRGVGSGHLLRNYSDHMRRDLRRRTQRPIGRGPNGYVREHPAVKRERRGA
jgi:hypothetical protein